MAAIKTEGLAQKFRVGRVSGNTAILGLTADRKAVVKDSANNLQQNHIVLGIICINDFQTGYVAIIKAINAIDKCSSVALNVYGFIPSYVFMQLASVLLVIHVASKWNYFLQTVLSTTHTHTHTHTHTDNIICDGVEGHLKLISAAWVYV